MKGRTGKRFCLRGRKRSLRTEGNASRTLALQRLQWPALVGPHGSGCCASV